jgi:hypothetical protein
MTKATIWRYGNPGNAIIEEREKILIQSFGYEQLLNRQLQMGRFFPSHIPSQLCRTIHTSSKTHRFKTFTEVAETAVRKCSGTLRHGLIDTFSTCKTIGMTRDLVPLNSRRRIDNGYSHRGHHQL